jgi:hypothetical protein
MAYDAPEKKRAAEVFLRLFPFRGKKELFYPECPCESIFFSGTLDNI